MDRVFKALADPTRRRILQLLREREMTARTARNPLRRRSLALRSASLAERRSAGADSCGASPRASASGDDGPDCAVCLGRAMAHSRVFRTLMRSSRSTLRRTHSALATVARIATSAARR